MTIKIIICFATWIIFCFHAVAQPTPTSKTRRLDATGLIDLQSPGSIASSCIIVGQRLRLATNQMQLKIHNKQFSTQNMDERWKYQRQQDEISRLADSGERMARRISANLPRMVPPSEMNRVTYYQIDAANRFMAVVGRNPNLGVQAYSYCAKKF